MIGSYNSMSERILKQTRKEWNVNFDREMTYDEI